MVRGWCPDCDTLQEIVDTGRAQNPSRGSSRWWALVLHKRPDRQELCDGGGKTI